MQGLCSISAHLWAPQKAGLRQPILIVSPFVWGSPRMQGLCSISARLWASSDFDPLYLGIPENAGSPCSSKGFRNIHQLCLENSIIRPEWGATSNSGRELTRGCYPFKQKYHLPCPPPPPPVAIFFAPTSVPQSDQRDEAAISHHICRGLEPPRPL